MDSLFFLTISVIFISAVIGVYTRRRSLDGCLKDFAGYQVTIELTDGRLIWGRLAVFSSGIELVYRDSHRDQRGHEETSYVLFPSEFDQIQAIYRYHDELAPERQKERRLDIERTYHPGFFRRTRRGLRNFFNTFRDAFNQSLGVAMSQVKKGQGAAVLKSQNKNIAAIGDTMLGSVANAYEPIMERYIGHRVVLEESRGSEIMEHPGILKEYTSTWIEILDSQHLAEHEFSLKAPEQLTLNRDLDFVVIKRSDTSDSGWVMRVENHGAESVFCKRLIAGDWAEDVGMLLPANGSAEFPLVQLPETELAALANEALPNPIAFRAQKRLKEGEVMITPDQSAHLPNLVLVVEAAREVDLCLPRRCAVLRHGGESMKG